MDTLLRFLVLTLIVVGLIGTSLVVTMSLLWAIITNPILAIILITLAAILIVGMTLGSKIYD